MVYRLIDVNISERLLSSRTDIMLAFMNKSVKHFQGSKNTSRWKNSNHAGNGGRKRA
ncbi:hypothetical protein P879_08674 [Paragonimus westermani]|uniref:Uncharacterized protein n=1 Tax=Paragonimus westermani TaxID=34504 RepID=A0A8T0DJ76_9TREM|nr:hypothetical protein P879_08674 [Paragonimus westermani]